MTPERARQLAAQLTYCTNVHPAETLEEVEAVLKTEVTTVAAKWRQRLGTAGSFPVGLRLSAQACLDLQAPERMAAFRSQLGEFGVFTLNGFPHGTFHGRPVKDQVYLPDWTSGQRVTYTEHLFSVLALLLPPEHYGSVSTVPGQFKPHQGAGSVARIAQQLLDVAASLVAIEREQGKELMLALEPEPGCLLETTTETVEFFEGQLLGRDALSGFAERVGVDISEAERLVRRHLGVCLDTCHAAVEFERSLDAYRRYAERGIRVGKIQISAGLECQPDKHDLQRLRAFDEPVYLHQVVQSVGDELRRFDDLPLALAATAGDARAAGERWRVHFHVPLFTEHYGEFSSTRADVAELLNAIGDDDTVPHLEVETYTWGVLPTHFVDRPLTDAIDAELQWAQGELIGSA